MSEEKKEAKKDVMKLLKSIAGKREPIYKATKGGVYNMHIKASNKIVDVSKDEMEELVKAKKLVKSKEYYAPFNGVIEVYRLA
jgi:hypothetical protein